MTETRIPDPTLMARLQLSVKGIEWAAGLVAHRQHEQPEGQWSAHQHLFHLLQVERQVYQPRLQVMLREEAPVIEWWDEGEHMQAEYSPEGDVRELASELVAERERTVEVLKSLTLQQWSQTAPWPAGEVDIAWAAERALAHSLEHFAMLLNLHQELEKQQAKAWLS